MKLKIPYIQIQTDRQGKGERDGDRKKKEKG